MGLGETQCRENLERLEGVEVGPVHDADRGSLRAEAGIWAPSCRQAHLWRPRPKPPWRDADRLKSWKRQVLCASTPVGDDEIGAVFVLQTQGFRVQLDCDAGRGDRGPQVASCRALLKQALVLGPKPGLRDQRDPTKHEQGHG